MKLKSQLECTTKGENNIPEFSLVKYNEIVHLNLPLLTKFPKPLKATCPSIKILQ